MLFNIWLSWDDARGCPVNVTDVEFMIDFEFGLSRLSDWFSFSSDTSSFGYVFCNISECCLVPVSRPNWSVIAVGQHLLVVLV